MGTIITDVEKDFFSHYPKEREIVKPFLSGFDVTWANHRKAYGSILSVFFLKPEPHMESSFGFESEILTIYSHYDSLEPRTIQAIDKFLSDEPAKGRIDTMTVFIISESKNPVAWIHQYATANRESRLLAGFEANKLREQKNDPWLVR